MKRLSIFLFLIFAFLFSACTAVTPPRLATATAQTALTPIPTGELFISKAPTPTPSAGEAAPLDNSLPSNPSLTVWINETSPEHRELAQEMAQEFTEQANIDVEMVMVSPLLLPDLVNTAVLSGTLPDLILHPAQYSIGWADRGILSSSAAAAAVNQIGRDTFDPAALDLLTANGELAALPSDGRYQIILYRTDWFANNNLAVPDSFDALYTAAETTNDRENLRAGFVVPTEANLVQTHQAFEQMALANGCQLIDEEGEVLLLETACVEAINFYYSIINQFSPPNVQTYTSTPNAYLNGRSGLILFSPEILPQLASIGAEPNCPQCGTSPTFLAENTGIVTTLTGSGSDAAPASFSEIMALGITTAADEETAVPFANYWFNEGYEKWLALESERKVPMRWGTSDQPRQFIDQWGTTPLAPNQPSLQDLFGTETVAQLRDGIAAAPRWGLPQAQGKLLTTLYEDLTVAVVLQEMLSGYFPPAQTINEMYNQVTENIPNYQFYPEPTATPEEEQ